MSVRLILSLGLLVLLLCPVMHLKKTKYSKSLYVVFLVNDDLITQEKIQKLLFSFSGICNFKLVACGKTKFRNTH